MLKKKIAAISGSLRPDSVNHRLLNTYEKLCGDWAVFDYTYQPGSLPYFNSASDTDNPPQPVQDFRNHLSTSDGIIICTPEYVFSLPGALKNALEWMVSTIILSNKPAALITASSVGEKAHESLLLVMKTIGARFTPATTQLISHVKTKVDINGNFIHLPAGNEALQLSIAFERLCKR